MKRLKTFLKTKTFATGCIFAVQLIIFITFISWFSSYVIYFYIFCLLLTFISVTGIFMEDGRGENKLSLLLFFILSPLFGGVFYYLFVSKKRSKRLWLPMDKVHKRYLKRMLQNENILAELEHESPLLAREAQYLYSTSGSPIYQNTEVTYLALGEIKYEYMLSELKKAKHFIFLEYFIISDGAMWDSILQILIAKIAQGVEVKLIYDELGSLGWISANFTQEMRELGIECYGFNPVDISVSGKANSRDHRKICVIDGKVGFTGGINIGDEYINQNERFGHWKDTAVMLKGEAVWTLTSLFLTMWEYVSDKETDVQKYQVTNNSYNEKGFVLPYSDIPNDAEYVGENIYISMIYNATKSIHICTPYLIIGERMKNALQTAARSGVDVTIITPFKADKWYIHVTTKSYYKSLIEAGVRIFEYTPGFIHAKSMVVDGINAVVGTINMDFRSFSLNFECGVWLYGLEAVKDIAADFAYTLSSSQEITLLQMEKYTQKYYFLLAFLRMFVGLM